MPRGVPFLFFIAEIGTPAVNLGGSGGQSPPATASRRACHCVTSIMWCLVNQQRRCESRFIACGVDCNRSFGTEL